jgi:ABC-2 type transport system permease protein
VQGHYQLENRSGAPMSNLILYQQPGMDLAARLSQPATLVTSDRERGFFHYRLASPLMPGARMALAFELSAAPGGLLGIGSDTPVVDNGSLLTNEALPRIGYQTAVELDDARDRRRHGLPRRATAVAAPAPATERIAFSAIVGTAVDQVAVAPGTLEREWIANERRYFHYRSDGAIPNDYAIASARYAVRHERWQDVAIDAYFTPGHEANVERLLRGAGAALDYGTRQFGPYGQHDLRLVETPRRGGNNHAYPGMLAIPEHGAFIARTDGQTSGNATRIDYPFYTGAWSTAQQWWKRQPGSSLLADSLAEYTALMAVRRTSGTSGMRRYLREDLRSYLMGRALTTRERPLVDYVNETWLRRSKGGLALYLLQDVLGEERVNGVLRGLAMAPATADVAALAAALRAVAPPDKAYLVHDLLEDVVLYENRAESASARPLANGKYEVVLRASAAKLRAGSAGEQDLALADYIEFGVDDRAGNPLVRERRRVSARDQVLTFVVAGRPARAGIDPDHKLIDKKPTDNMVLVDNE